MLTGRDPRRGSRATRSTSRSRSSGGRSGGCSSSRRRAARGGRRRYEDGMLTVELPLRPGAAGPRRSRSRRSGDSDGDPRAAGSRPPRQLSARARDGASGGHGRVAAGPGRRCCRCATRSTFPDMLIPLNVGQPRSVELIKDVLARRPHARAGRRAQPRDRVAGAGRPLRGRRRRGRRADDAGARRHACGCWSRAASGSGSTRWCRPSPTWSPRSPSCPTSSDPSTS